MRITVDVGGTFTDVILLDDVTGEQRLEKVETTPDDPTRGVLAGFAKAGADAAAIDYFVHGTTLGLNALLTRTGAAVAIVTTRGFRDIYELGRTSRDPMYDFKYRKPRGLVPRSLAFEVTERMDFQGTVLQAFDEEGARAVARRIADVGVQAVVVCFLHSYANPAHELAMREVLAQECPDLFVTLSHELSREYREYERTSTAVIDAYIKPVIQRYLEDLDRRLSHGGFRGRFLLTRSGGGAMTLASAREQPVHLVHSGPAGGVIGAAYLGRLIGQGNLITLDMGGTSLDASLILDGQTHLENEAQVDGMPVSVPMIDIRTIGAGGGSIGWIDDGGHLQMGPQSAGAVPGPACYGKGGTLATFTDAALVAGYLDPSNFLGGEVNLDLALARQAVEDLAGSLGLGVEETAAGMIRISEAKIAGATREISVERGYDPRDFALLAFGGGGGFVAASVAREVGVPVVVVPPGPANFSAWGMLTVDVVHDFARTHVASLGDIDLQAINDLFQGLVDQGRQALAADGFSMGSSVFERSAELRYSGQEHAVCIPLPDRDLTAADLPGIMERFNEAHLMHYGHHMEDPVELVTVRLRASGLLKKPAVGTIAEGTGDAGRARKGERRVFPFNGSEPAVYTVYDRNLLGAGDRIAGPAIIEEVSSTTVLHTGDVLTVGAYGELLIAVGGGRE